MIEQTHYHEVRTFRVIDADTLDLCLYLGCEISVDRHVRLARCNAAEIGTADGQRAAAYVETLLDATAGHPLVIFERGICDRYGRLVAEVYYTHNGTDYSNLSDTLIMRKVARDHDYGRDTCPHSMTGTQTVDTTAPTF